MQKKRKVWRSAVWLGSFAVGFFASTGILGASEVEEAAEGRPPLVPTDVREVVATGLLPESRVAAPDVRVESVPVAQLVLKVVEAVEPFTPTDLLPGEGGQVPEPAPDPPAAAKSAEVTRTSEPRDAENAAQEPGSTREREPLLPNGPPQGGSMARVFVVRSPLSLTLPEPNHSEAPEGHGGSGGSSATEVSSRQGPHGTDDNTSDAGQRCGRALCVVAVGPDSALGPPLSLNVCHPSRGPPSKDAT